MRGASADRLARALLVLGVIGGITAAAIGLLRSGAADGSLPGDAVALVNGEPITTDAFARLEAAVAAERRGAPLDASQRERLLDRLVDEELLLQRGLALGLARYDPTARRAIVSSLLTTVTADGESEEPDEPTLRSFYEEASERFQLPGRVVAEVLFVSTVQRPEAEAVAQAAEAASRIRAGEGFADVEQTLGDPQTAPLPRGPLPLETLRAYIGPSPALAVARLLPGEVSEPVRGGAGYYVLRLLERSEGSLRPFAEVREQVRAEWLRARGERALADYLEELRRGADVKTKLPPTRGEAG